jgi:DNA-binding MarR family transcriptional regulator
MTVRTSRLQAEIKQTRPFGSTAEEAAIAILRTADALRHHFGAVIEPHGVTQQQYNVLRILRGSHPEPLPTLEIGERLIERVPGITRLIDRLEEKGLVARKRDADDRRRVNCSITEKGLALLARLDPIVAAADRAAVGDLGEAESEALVELLERIRESHG